MLENLKILKYNTSEAVCKNSRNGIKKSCSLFNIKTGKVINAESIAELSRKLNCPANNTCFRFLVDKNPVMYSYKNWTSPQIAETIIELKDIHGNLIKDNIASIARKYNLSVGDLYKIKIGKKQKTRNLFRADNPLLEKFLPFSKKIKEISMVSSGKVIKANSVGDMAKKLSCTRAAIYYILHGQCSGENIGVKIGGIKYQKRSIFNKLRDNK